VAESGEPPAAGRRADRGAARRPRRRGRLARARRC